MNAGGGGGGSSIVPAGGTLTVPATVDSRLVVITYTLEPRAEHDPAALVFGTEDVGRTGTSQTVVVTNDGVGPLAFGGAAITGPGASSFATTSDACSHQQVPVGESCSVVVQFRPQALGALSATLTLPDNASATPDDVSLSGTGRAPADLKILGAGSVYTGQGHLVTRGVTESGKLRTYKVGILNEDTVARSFKVRLTQSGATATASLWTTGAGAHELPVDGGDYVTPAIAPGKAGAYLLKVTPTAVGQTTSRVDVDLLTDLGVLIEGIDTETNTAAPSAGTTGYELFVKNGSQPSIGGPVSGQTMTGPALKVGQKATYSLRLQNDGAGSGPIGLHVWDLSACPAFTTTVKVGSTDITAAAMAGTYYTPVLAPSKHKTVVVTVKRVSIGCGATNLLARSLDSGGPVRSSYLLTNAAYDAATD
ncbi:choice-of-anchor D domain-containing protein [Nocardioides humilatus]|uniref:Choice-of-anchor D domain-containing protein n=2 Tax=Nocardioides humilatus TaxID=2607660 RepID=A0A5B1LFJ0_9ACTN|nr:choice-of-anchor D domain-containing protein [Nocardioides humilatus]